MPLPAETQSLLTPEAWTTITQASTYSCGLLSKANEICAETIGASNVDRNLVCVSVIGSIGREEALSASDMDLLPVWAGEEGSFASFDAVMDKLRQRLREELAIDVSTSRDLMRSVHLSDLLRPETIGGDIDDRRRLTQRVLLLTESGQAGGDLPIDIVRRQLLEAYAGKDLMRRTAGRHPLAASNDIARFFRTVCLDYKSRTESKPESWCLRNVKLRGARKFWYFSTMLSVTATLLDNKDADEAEVFEALAHVFSKTPVSRLLYAASIDGTQASASRLLEEYAIYLREMSSNETREALNKVPFDERLSEALTCGENNPFPKMYDSAKRIHDEMIATIYQSRKEMQRRILDWFLL